MASAAGVTVSWLARLEQGKAHAVSADVLDALSRALDLDELERAHLFALAGLRLDASSVGLDEVPASVAMLLHALEPCPAYVLDRAWNIVAWNASEAALFPPLTSTPKPNLLELVFLDERIRRLIVDHDAESAHLVSQFRTHGTDWPGDRSIAEVVERLTAASPDFARRWAAHDVAPLATTRRVFDHPRAGRLELDHQRLAVLDGAGMILVVYLDPPGGDSVARLAAAAEG